MDTVQIGTGKRRLLSILDRDRLARVLARVLDETEFLSPHGVRALSRIHMTEPYEVELDGVKHRVDYEPGESSTGLFGGNSNWRGPVWFPVNYLMIEALQKYHHYCGESFRIECPTGSGRDMNLGEPSARRGTGEAALVPTAEVVQTSTLLVTGAAARVAPNILSIAHWDRLLGGALYAPLSRLDWATLLRRTFDVDVKRCHGCGGRMTVRALVTDAASIARLLGALRRSREPPVAA